MKILKGDPNRTVKGCLSASIFKKNDDDIWEVSEKCHTFIDDANRKLNDYLKKVKLQYFYLDFLIT